MPPRAVTARPAAMFRAAMFRAAMFRAAMFLAALMSALAVCPQAMQRNRTQPTFETFTCAQRRLTGRTSH
ncbi:hypothetical protein [Frankia sp. QA3]|uniref:hypothetical protein n=1 Tax=Frankia sp. QA3 TaxID=710111 RepID=UPI00055C2F9C|nr:hypothetical protein [Frankia sp. QA3]